MRALHLASSLTALLALAACAAETETPQRTVRKGSTSTPAPGATNNNGEHGTNTPGGLDTAPDPGTELASETWADGKTITSNVTIKAGATVDIAPGATVTVSKGVAISVKGTLKVASTAKHAKITGTDWAGLVIGQGGALTADGLDLLDAGAAIWTQAGNASATLTNGVIQATTPFKMEPGSKLAVTRTKVSAAGGSAIAGTFTASFMEYDKGTSGGLTLNDPAGTMTISDSILKGAGGGDYVISDAGKLIRLEYTTIAGSHCGLHFSAIDQFQLDHVSDDTNSYGAMLYGSGAGPHTIVASNVRSTQVDLDMKGTNGPLTITNSLTGGKDTLSATTTVTGARTTPVADAKPRGAL